MKNVRYAGASVLALFLMVVMMLMGAVTAGAQGTPQIWNSLNAMGKDQRLASLKEQATKDGKVVVYGTLGIDRAQAFIDLFEKQYPGIKVDFVRLTTGEVSQKVLAEQKAGRVGADVIIANPAVLELISSTIAPYEPTNWKDFDPRFRHGGGAAGWNALDYEILPYAIAWRTDRIPASEAPKTFEALYNPKWQGRMGTVTVLEPMVQGLIDVFGETKGMEKVNALASTKSRNYPSIGALSGGLASGEIDIAWNIGAYRAVELKRSGAPVDFVIEDPAFAVTDTISVTREAPRPHAAALFIEFMTTPSTLEALDKLQPGRIAGNTIGNYQYKIADFPSLYVFKPLDKANFTKLNRLVEQLFIRR